MKKTFIAILITLLLLSAMPLSVIGVGFGLPAQFSETYYGVLADMYGKLYKTEGKKIVIIGNSAVAFGVDSELMEAHLQGYTVCNFGLYGALGTKLMLDLSKDAIGEGDVVVIMPEQEQQSLSLYYSALNTLYAMDSNFGMLSGIASENVAETVGNFPAYTAEKLARFYSEPAEVTGVYAKSSFDEDCVMRFPREYNKMTGLFDSNVIVKYSKVSADFIEYVNDYAASVGAAGGTTLFGFSPVNERAISSEVTPDCVQAYYDSLCDALNFSVIGLPSKAIMNAGYFYDSNFHVNDAGMIVNTARLIDDVKTALAISTPTDIVLPDPPIVPDDEEEEFTGDNSDADLFEYEIDVIDGKRIAIVTALKSEGAARSSVTIPHSYDGAVVRRFNASVFAGNKSVREITVQDGVSVISNRSFDGCSSLTALNILNTDPTAVSVSRELLYGAENCTVFVPESSYSSYISDYFWGLYSSRIKVNQV